MGAPGEGDGEEGGSIREDLAASHARRDNHAERKHWHLMSVVNATPTVRERKSQDSTGVSTNSTQYR